MPEASSPSVGELSLAFPTSTSGSTGTTLRTRASLDPCRLPGWREHRGVVIVGNKNKPAYAWRGPSRALAARADFIEIHAAYGYLLSSFLSLSSNKRTDSYGGSFENRIHLSLKVTQLTRDTVGSRMPKLENTVDFAHALAEQGCVDLIDISSGGVHATRKAPFAAAVKKAVGNRLLVAAVGMINHGDVAENILQDENLDLILVGRAFQRDTSLAWAFAKDLDVEIAMAAQIRWGFTSFRNASDYIQPNSMKASIFD
ncbi:hypothetical protein NUU61_008293 [Penicillium alfredii]|uniref:NADH:flavin oxidoreductase/NADH oxidase N-terminal domain-containing protein n=1 Tax=Penicillium alfredii TaxID=1506179 RepID=A0A9W9JZD3_9EURO|nr:uncharacterized protein NUU61_008293 [Penicillium alfredii]KAJ5086986.1 hypothetical protein NUU61_008293 [Penicillium alfredii]